MIQIKMLNLNRKSKLILTSPSRKGNEILSGCFPCHKMLQANTMEWKCLFLSPQFFKCSRSSAIAINFWRVLRKASFPPNLYFSPVTLDLDTSTLAWTLTARVAPGSALTTVGFAPVLRLHSVLVASAAYIPMGGVPQRQLPLLCYPVFYCTGKSFAG